MTRNWNLLSPLAALVLVTAGFSVGCGSDGERGPAGQAGTPGAEGKEGPEGKPGAGGGDPSVSAVQPGRVFLDRTLDVSISGFGTNWVDGATAEFGAGITVNKTLVASGTGIVANITIDPTATTGVRDVSVKQGSATTTFKGAFTVEAPLVVGEALGTPSQGSILLSSATLLDLNTPFDTTHTGDNLLVPYEFQNLSVTAGAGVAGPALDAQPYSLAYQLFIDVDAAAGINDVVVTSGEISSVDPAALTVAARTPTDLTGPMTATIANPFESVLYKYTAGASSEAVTISVSSADMTASPAIALLPASGKFADLISYGSDAIFTAHGGDLFYVVYFDGTPTSGYDFDIAVTSTPVVDETEPNGACGMAQALTLTDPPVAASLSDKDDQDWFAITATAADVGKVIHVVTSPGEPNTDTFVDVLLGNCVTSLGGPSSDLDYHEDFTSDPIPSAGTYYVTVTNSPDFPLAGSAYLLSVTLE